MVAFLNLKKMIFRTRPPSYGLSLTERIGDTGDSVQRSSSDYRKFSRKRKLKKGFPQEEAPFFFIPVTTLIIIKKNQFSLLRESLRICVP
jgi:hypothetical protein